MSKRWIIAVVTLLVVSGCSQQDRKTSVQEGSSPTASPSGPSDAPAINLPASRLPRPTATATATLKPLPTQGGTLSRGAVQPAEAGERLYDQTGVTKIRGCFTSDKPPNTPLKLSIEKPSGSRQHLVRDQRDAEGRGEVTTVVVEYREDGTYLAFLRQQTQFPVESTVEFQPDPPVLLMPAAPKDGFAWTFKLVSTDGAIAVVSDSKIERAEEQVRIGASDISTTRASSISRVTGKSSTGTLDLTITATSWYSAARRLDVKSQTFTKGTAGLCEVDSQVDSVMRL